MFDEVDDWCIISTSRDFSTRSQVVDSGVPGSFPGELENTRATWDHGRIGQAVRKIRGPNNYTTTRIMPERAPIFLQGAAKSSPVVEQATRTDPRHTRGIVADLNQIDQSLESTPPNAPFFDGAHDFVIHNPTFIYTTEKCQTDPAFLDKFCQNLASGGAVLLILDRKRVAGVEVDSSEREYAPRCHPETRKEMRLKLKAWLSNPKRHWCFIWLSGPAGAGKSAVSQTFAEHCQELGQLGATFFFSKLQNRDSPHGLIATIAYQLADRHAGYNYLITRTLSRNPSILDKTLRIQFHKLIIEPFTILANDYANAVSTTTKPLVIIIDGLDECSDERAQCEIIRLVGEYVQRSRLISYPLLWLISSRSEWHLKREFAYADPPIGCGREEMTCDAAEDANDVYRILKDGLQEIRDKTTWSLTQSQLRSQWPAESQLQRLSQKVGGLPILASTVLRFIGDSSGSPDSLLEICLLCLEDAGDANKTNTLAVLDAFYRRIMKRVPQFILPTTKQIIAFLTISSRYETLYASDLAYFLQITKDTFYAALQHLHSVIDVPPSELGHEKPLKFFHKSFGDFLEDPVRSKSFALDMDQARFEFAKLSLRWYNHLLQEQCQLSSCSHPAMNEASLADPCLVRDLDAASRMSFNQRFSNLLKYHWGTICASVSDSYRSEIAVEIIKFNFCHFDLIECIDQNQKESMHNFLTWYLKKPMDDSSQQPLIRFKPLSELDEALARASQMPPPQCDSPLHELSAGKTSDFTFYFRSLHRSRKFCQKPTKESVVMGIWIGRGRQSTLVLVVKRV